MEEKEAVAKGQVPVRLYINAAAEEISVDAALVALLSDVHKTDTENGTKISWEKVFSLSSQLALEVRF